LPYTVEVRPLSSNEGGGYVATIPILGRNTFVAVGETVPETLESLEELKRILIPDMLEQGVPLPEPEKESAEDYSGSMMLRVPPMLHAELVRASRKQSVSLNKLSTYLLAQGLAYQDAQIEFRSTIREIVNEEIQSISGRWHDNSQMRVTTYRGLNAVTPTGVDNPNDDYQLQVA
ncbi:MAG: toxin-antitoxin system HicB family antitoxin, partial [Armatimonadetes bacterium]|nr:toxin-antitoxin system HicB family antitoxin [Armatimonadota bacterium]